MSSVTKFAVVILCWFAYSLSAWGQVHIPGNDDGYLIKDAKNSHQNAPSGYEGRPVANYETLKSLPISTTAALAPKEQPLENQDARWKSPSISSAEHIR